MNVDWSSSSKSVGEYSSSGNLRGKIVFGKTGTCLEIRYSLDETDEFYKITSEDEEEAEKVSLHFPAEIAGSQVDGYFVPKNTTSRSLLYIIIQYDWKMFCSQLSFQPSSQKPVKPELSD